MVLPRFRNKILYMRNPKLVLTFSKNKYKHNSSIILPQSNNDSSPNNKILNRILTILYFIKVLIYFLKRLTKLPYSQHKC